MRVLDAGFAEALAVVGLANVTREYPRKLDHMLTAPPGDLTPRAIHPVFYGSYDWHSAVHMHWLLVRLLRVYPSLSRAADIAAILGAHLGAAQIAVEQTYFETPVNRTFERPYGWGWVLVLHAEALRLSASRHDALRWAKALDPFARYIAGRLSEFLALAVYPIRAGMHANTAFACILALDYARVAGDAVLAADIGTAARKWHLADRDAPLAYEPSLTDFLSPSLVVAHLMCEVLPRDEFRAWLNAFLPAGLGPLGGPPCVPDRTDAQLSHLDGLSLSRAWSLRRIAAALGLGEDNEFTAAAVRHLEAGLPQAAGGDYVGEHWLASFAALALGETP